MSEPRPDDAAHMRHALELAERGWGRVAPNPLVGAVVVRDGAVVGEGWHAEYGQPHAEAAALRQAGERARGATLYVTLEPCNHHGKTPPCSAAVLEAGIARLVYAVADPNPRAEGGAARLRAAGVEVVGGVEEQRARDLNAPFLHRHSAQGARRPWIQLKLALSLDARVADARGRSAWITGPPARAAVHRMRAAHDAVVVGIGTALADDPLLTVRDAPPPRLPPVRVVLDRRLRLPAGSRLARSVAEAPLWVVCAPDADPARERELADAGARVLRAEALADALERLAGEGLASLLVEGGGVLASALLEAEAVDRLALFYAPLLLGRDGRPAFGGVGSPGIEAAFRWRRLRTTALGADTLIELQR